MCFHRAENIRNILKKYSMFTAKITHGQCEKLWLLSKPHITVCFLPPRVRYILGLRSVCLLEYLNSCSAGGDNMCTSRSTITN